MKVKPYPKTKPSGIEWLGNVPEHWALVALKRYVRRYAGGTPDRNNESYWEDGTIPWINSGCVNQRLITEPTAYITSDGYANSSAKYVPRHALVMALAGQGKTKGMVAQMGIAATCNQSMAAICPRPPIQSRYLYWLLVSQYEHIRNMAGGEQRDGLNLEMLGNIPCLIPFETEQTAIAAYLDRETGRIDELVEKKRTLIERLKEKRSALISACVTRGLPSGAGKKYPRIVQIYAEELQKSNQPRPSAFPADQLPENPPLKPSGIEWLGDIPEHWEVKRFGYISAVVRGASPRPAGDSRFFDGDFIPWITVGEITRDRNVYLRSTSSMLTEEGAEISRTIRSGTLVLTNSGATLGVPKILSITGCANDGVVAFESLSDCANRLFLYYYLTSLTQSLRDRIKQGSGQPNLNTEIVRGIHVPLPPLPEQKAIATYLDEETAIIDALVAKVETAIERLLEYRSALITAAVTGKIDVRKEDGLPIEGRVRNKIEV